VKRAGQSNRVKSKPTSPQQVKQDKRHQGKARVSKAPLPAASEAERRQLTIMFCDLVGSTPLTVYRVLGASAAQSRFAVAVTAGLTPLVGREHEMGLLRERAV
jgi:class 3 adenylate cyclase